MEKKGDKYGGSEDFSEYKIRDTVSSCDKLSHALRSIAHQPNHLSFWKKVGRIFTYEKPINKKVPPTK